MMKAAVVRDFSTGPHYEGNFLAPIPEASMTKIEVTASALSNVARSVASGQHYSVQHTSLPVVPGIDDAATIATNLASVGENVDMVLDYLWGDVTASALTAIIPARADANQLLTWVNIGSVVGPTTALPAASLRAVNLRLVGSGFGPVKMAQLLSLLQGIADAEVAQPFVFEVRREALTDIAQVWTEKTSERIVFVL
ncbi:hypothetical protein [Weissella soli]|uniref:hypothetical protein n=1 Tax=Weissella soli TaxID=155866 RepID=UPI0035A1C3DE